MEKILLRILVVLVALILSGLVVGQVFLIRSVKELKSESPAKAPLVVTAPPAVSTPLPAEPSPAPEPTNDSEGATRAVSAVEDFVGEQKKIDAYQSAKLEYLLDSVRMLEALALLPDAATEQERRRLQVELDDALTKRAQSRDRYERATRSFGESMAAIDRQLATAGLVTPTPTAAE